MAERMGENPVGVGRHGGNPRRLSAGLAGTPGGSRPDRREFQTVAKLAVPTAQNVLARRSFRLAGQVGREELLEGRWRSAWSNAYAERHRAVGCGSLAQRSRPCRVTGCYAEAWSHGSSAAAWRAAMRPHTMFSALPPPDMP